MGPVETKYGFPVETKYGFKWGAVEVERTLSHERARVITLRTQQEVLEVYVTPTGFIKPRTVRKRGK